MRTLLLPLGLALAPTASAEEPTTDEPTTDEPTIEDEPPEAEVWEVEPEEPPEVEVREVVPDVSGDVALTYGRNFAQGLNVAGFVGELKANVDPQIALGVRAGGGLGAGFGASSVQGYLGAPLLLKGEGFLGRQRQRPFVGLGAGVTWVAAVGAYASPSTATAVGYTVSGFMPTIMPELGVDLGNVRLAVSHSVLIGSDRGIAAQLGLEGVEVGSEAVPGLSGTVLQVGGHFGGARAPAAVEPVVVDADVGLEEP